MSMEDLKQATLAQRGLQQFEKMHAPVEKGNTIECEACEEDWPCMRMSLVLISQSISMLVKMIPGGGISSVLSRFSQSQPSG